MIVLPPDVEVTYVRETQGSPVHTLELTFPTQADAKTFVAELPKPWEIVRTVTAEVKDYQFNLLTQDARATGLYLYASLDNVVVLAVALRGHVEFQV